MNWLTSNTSISSSIEQNGVLNLKKQFPKEFRDELFSRIISFFGDDNFKKVENSFVIVVGLGGVGSHAANMLVRSGVQKIRLIDFDQVSLSSLNRHSVATMDDVGKQKAVVTRDRLLSVVPWCDIEARVEMFRGDKADTLLEPWIDTFSHSTSSSSSYSSTSVTAPHLPDYVVDCIDDVNTKADLIAYCLKNNIRVLTSMGAGGKADPTRLRIAPLSDCINDPLATKIKWKLKKQHSIPAESVMALFSIEKPMVELLPLDDEQYKAPQDFGAVDYMRLRVVPVLGTSPSIFGQAMTSYILCQLAGLVYEPESCEKLSKNLKHKLKQHFHNNELKRFHTTEFIDLDDDDIDFIVCQVWRSRCAITGRKFGGHSTLVLTRWNPLLPPSPYNLVLLMPEEAERLAGTVGNNNSGGNDDNNDGGTGKKKKYKHNSNNINTNSNDTDDNINQQTPTTNAESSSDLIMGSDCKSHLSSELINKIDTRLLWAKALYLGESRRVQSSHSNNSNSNTSQKIKHLVNSDTGDSNIKMSSYIDAYMNKDSTSISRSKSVGLILITTVLFLSIPLIKLQRRIGWV